MLELRSMLDMSSWLRYETFVRRLPFLFYLFFLAALYIGNRHRVEKQVRQLDAVNKDLIEMRWHYEASKEELAKRSRQSSVATLVVENGVRELTRPPFIIEVSEDGN